MKASLLIFPSFKSVKINLRKTSYLILCENVESYTSHIWAIDYLLRLNYKYRDANILGTRLTVSSF